MSYKYRVCFFALFLFGLFAVENYIYSASTGLTIQPIKISQTIEPGESVSGVISLDNASDQKVKVEMTVEDFIPASGSTNVQFIGRTEGVTTVRDWITLKEPDDFIFKKGESKEVRYTIQAPSNAEPGGHFGVIFFKASELASEGALKVGTRVGVLVFVTIPGNQLQKGKILDFSGPFFVQKGPVIFQIKFENTGTVHFEPKGTITIKNISGKEVGKVQVAGQAVLPTGVRDLTASWNVEGLLLGRYTAELNIFDGEGNELTADRIAFYAFPVWYLASFIAVVVALFFGIRFLRRKVKISFSANK